MLDLSLDIDDAMGFGLCLLEEQASLSGQQPYSPVSLLEQLCGGVVEDETCGLLIGLEPQLFRDKSDIHIRFVTAVSY